MTALSAARNTPQRTGDVLGFPVAASTTCYQGGIAVLNGGFAEPASTATGLVAIGRFDETVVNGTVTDGAVHALVRAGTFRFANSASADLIAQADVGADCYLVDDQTVAKTSAANTRSIAGKVVAVEADGVWVKLGL
jgi:hypothetical protein